MLGKYSIFYDLEAKLSAEGDLIPPPQLASEDPDELYAQLLGNLSQPRRDGSPNPFTGRFIGSAESALLQTLCQVVAYNGHELNLVPNHQLIGQMRLFGLTRRYSKPTLYELEFTKRTESIQSLVSIPVGTVLLASSGTNSVSTIQSLTIPEGQRSGKTLAKLSGQPGSAYTPGGYSIIQNNLSGIASAKDIGIASRGQSLETWADFLIRSRQSINNAGRCVTTSDYYREAKLAGAKRVIVLPQLARMSKVSDTSFDGVTIAVYPAETVSAVEARLAGTAPELQNEELGRGGSVGARLIDPYRVIAADLVPLVGNLELRVDTDDAIQIKKWLLTAVRKTASPDAGSWGLRNTTALLLEELERIEGIYAAKGGLYLDKTSWPDVSIPGEIGSLEWKPWHLPLITNRTRCTAVYRDSTLRII